MSSHKFWTSPSEKIGSGRRYQDRGLCASLLSQSRSSHPEPHGGQSRGGSPTRIHLALIKHSEKRTPLLTYWVPYRVRRMCHHEPSCGAMAAGPLTKADTQPICSVLRVSLLANKAKPRPLSGDTALLICQFCCARVKRVALGSF